MRDQLDARDNSLKENQKDKEDLRATASARVDSESIRKDMEKKDAKIKSLEEELGRVTTDYEASIRVIDSLERKRKDQEDDLENLDVQRRSIMEKDGQIETLREMDILSSSTVQILQGKVKTYQEELQAKAAALGENERAQKELQHRIIKLEEHIEQLKLANSEMDELKAKTDSLQLSLEDLNSSLQFKSHELVTSHNKIAELEKSIENLEKEAANQLGDIKEFITVNDYYQTRSKECETEKANLADNINNLTNQLDGCEVERAELRQKVGELLAKSEANLLAAEAAETTEKARKEEIKRLQAELTKVKAQNGQMYKALKELVEDREKARVGMKALLNENADLAGKVESGRKCEKENIVLKEQVKELEQEIKALHDYIDINLMKGIEDRDEYIRGLEKERANKEARLDYLLKDATKTDKKLEDRDKKITILSKELQQAESNLKRCQQDRLDHQEMLRECEENCKKKKVEIDVLKDELRRAGPGMSRSEDENPVYSPRTPSRRVEQQISAALSDDEGEKTPGSRSVPPLSSRKQAKTRKRPGRPPAQIVTRAKSTDTGDLKEAGVADGSMESVVSSSPTGYVGPPPVPASVDLAILRTELALRQMRNERAQHGFRTSDSIMVRGRSERSSICE